MSTDDFRLDGRTALVTGGSRGIGFGIARAMAEAGADVALIARGERTLESARDTIEKTGRKVWIYPFDMSRVEQIAETYDRIVQDTGGIDVLANNAGMTVRGFAQDMSLADWRSVIDVNLTSLYVLSQAFGRERIRTGRRGKIINIASLMSDTVREKNSPYAASKGGVRQLTKALAVDWARNRINVNAIGPGYIKTDLTRALWEDAEFDGWVKRRTPMGRWGAPEDLGKAAVFLASPASDFVTGQILYVDGGFLSTF